MRRLYIAAIRYISGAKYPPRESALINLDAAFISQDRHTIGGCIVNKKDGVLRFTRELNATEGPLSWGNRSLGKMWDGRWLVTEQEGTNTKGALTIRALGEAISEVPDWRSTGLPKASLVASPSVWRGGELLSAPLAGHQNGFDARIVADFTSFLVSR
jgi:tRNA(Ile)-lysidine synthase